MRRVFVLLLAVAALVLGPVRTGRPDAIALVPMKQDETPRDEFVSNGVYDRLAAEALPKNILTRGSWVEGDAFTGDSASPWYAAEGAVALFVSGYPRLEGNHLELEVDRGDAGTLRLPFDGENPGERWTEWQPALPAGAKSFRILAMDHSREARGWLAYSHPYRGFNYPVWKKSLQLLQIATSFCLVLAVLFGPGLWWLRRHPARLTRNLEAALLGPLLLGGLGVVVWCTGGLAPPLLLARVGVGLLLAALIAAELALPRSAGMQIPGGSLGAVLRLTVCVAALAVAKSTLSFGPTGEMYRGTESRTLSPSGHSDSRISFHLVQVIAHHLSPNDERARSYFAPWQITSRGPLAGLIAAPLVLATGADVPLGMPELAWTPFDRGGFTVYRISLILLASLSLLVVYGAMEMVSDDHCAALAAGLVGVAPFFVHELYFTWPKLAAASAVIASFALIHRGRGAAAGFSIGLGYLFHPLAILSTPFLALWGMGVARRPFTTWSFVPVVRLGLALVLTIGGWIVCDRMVTAQLGANGQGKFLAYFQLADNHPADLSAWLSSRWSNLACTFLPGYLFFTDPKHESLNSIYGISSRLIHISFAWWNSLPCAFGVLAFFATLGPVLRGAFRHACAALILFIAPAAFLVVYWGAADTGLMRHCGHVLFLTYICLTAWCVRHDQGVTRTPFLAGVTFGAIRAVELLFVLLATTLEGASAKASSVFRTTDLVAGICVVLLTALASWMAGRLARGAIHYSA